MTETKKRPTHAIYKVTGDGDDARFFKVGVAFVHKDDQGFSLIFDAIPLDGRIAMREITERQTTEETQGPMPEVQSALPLDTEQPQRSAIVLPDPLARTRAAA